MMRRIILSIGLFFVLLALLLLVSPRQKITSDKAEEFNEFLTAIIEEAAIPGLAVAVIKENTVTHLEGYGFADVEAARAMTPDTPMNIASISKPILGITLLQLKDRGLLDLDTDINNYLPYKIDNPHFVDETITLRNLATHTSGIGDWYDTGFYEIGADSPILLDDHIRRLLTTDGALYESGAYYLETLPGTVREYSNTGAGVAGSVAENVGQAPLNELSRIGVFAPLEMTNTSWLLSDYSPNELATRYEVRQCIPYIGYCATSLQNVANFLIDKVFNPSARFNTFEAYPHYGNPNYPDGGVNASIRDLTKLTLSILNGGIYDAGRLLTAESFDEMLELQLPTDISTRQRFFWRDSDGLTGHSGSDLGVFTSLYFDAGKGNAVVVLMNRSPDSDVIAAMDQILERAKASFEGD